MNTPTTPAGWHEFTAGVTAVLRSWSALATAVAGGWGGVESQAKAEFLRQTIYSYFAAGVLPEEDNSRPLPGQSTIITLRPTPLIREAQELEDHLAIYLEEEFSVQLEDSSERQVAWTVLQLYQQCCRDGNFTLAQQVVGAAIVQEEQQGVTQQQAPQAVFQSSEDDDDDDDDDMMGMGTTTTTTPQIPAQIPAAQLPPQQPPTQLPSAQDYAAALLFATPEEQARHLQRQLQNSQPDPNVRQLGQAAPEPEPADAMVDDDGFAPVVKKKNKNRR